MKKLRYTTQPEEIRRCVVCLAWKKAEDCEEAETGRVNNQKILRPVCKDCLKIIFNYAKTQEV